MANIEMFALANVLLALFILAFGVFSVRYVWPHKKKRGSWVLLLSLGLVLFVTQALNLLGIAGYFNLETLRPMMDLLFLVVMLFTVVFQYNLISTSHKEHKKN